MWGWSARVAEFADAAAFTRTVSEPEPTVTDPVDDAEDDDMTSTSSVRPEGYDLAG